MIFLCVPSFHFYFHVVFFLYEVHKLCVKVCVASVEMCLCKSLCFVKLSKRYECISLLLQTQARQANLCRLSVYIFVCLFHTIYFIGIQIFNNSRRKFSKIPLDSAYKYATRNHNKKAKQIIMNEQSE